MRRFLVLCFLTLGRAADPGYIERREEEGEVSCAQQTFNSEFGIKLVFENLIQQMSLGCQSHSCELRCSGTLIKKEPILIDRRCTELLQILREKEIKCLTIQGCQFYPQTSLLIIEDFLSYFSDLQSLRVRDSLWSDLPPHLLKRFESLENFAWINNKRFRKIRAEVLAIPSGFFENNRGLKNLSLSRNNLSQLPRNILGHLDELNMLDLSHNSLKEFPLVPGKKLINLNLSGNALTKLPPELTKNIKDLTEIDLSGNEFESVPVDLLQQNANLVKVVWEQDDCSRTNGTRHFDENVFDKSKKLRIFRYSFKLKNDTTLCNKLIFPKMSSLEELSLTNTSLQWNEIEGIISKLQSLKYLDVRDNRIQNLNILQLPKTLKTLKISRNRELQCDQCSNLKQLVHKFWNDSDSDVINSSCQIFDDGDKEFRFYDLKFYSENVCDVTRIEMRVTSIIIGVSLLIFLCFALYFFASDAILAEIYQYQSLQLLFLSETEPEGKRFDAFISYAHKDAEFASDIVERLEDPSLTNGRNFKICIHERDWKAGQEISQNVIDSVHSSRRTIVVLSPEFVQSQFCKFEFSVAYQSFRTSTDKMKLLVIMRTNSSTGQPLLSKDELSQFQEIHDYVRSYTYLKENDPYFWKKLVYYLPHKRMNERFKSAHKSSFSYIKV